MSSHSSNSSESDRKSIKALLKQLSRDFQSLSYRQLEHEAQLREGCSFCIDGKKAKNG